MTTQIAILTAIFNTFGLAAALAGLVWLAMKCVRLNAATRGIVWWAVLAMLLVLPLAPRLTSLLQRRTAASPHSAAVATRQHFISPEVDAPAAIMTLPERPAARWPQAIFALWGIVLLYKFARITHSYFHLRRVKQNATISDLHLPHIDRSARLLMSREIASPMAVGFLHAAVILPEDLADRITREELEQVLLHEAAHLARRDDWSNLLARLLGAILALHPVAWWILRQIEYEREAACDDWVVARTGAARPYAESLARMIELRWKRDRSGHAEEALASGVFGRGSRIGDRIEMLLQSGREFSPRVSFKRVAAGVFGLICLAAAGSFAPRWVAFAAPQTTPPQAFEVASVKPTDGTTASDWIRPRLEDSQRFRARTTVEQFIEWAYGIREFQILRAPEWLKKQQFDIQATAARPSNEDQFREMLQGLLAERFRLKVHRQTQELPVYELVIGKAGPKLTTSDGVQYCCGGEINIGQGAFIARGATMPLFVRILTDNLDRPVLDKTGLTDHYDFDLTYDFVEGRAWTPIGPALFTLVQDLGLRLEPQKDSVEMLVVDSVERPSEN